MKKIIIYPVILILLVSLFAIPVSAADVNGNEFIDMDDYAEYSFSDDKTIVNIDCVFPTSWIETFLYDGSFSGSSFMHSYKGSPVDANELVDDMYLFIRPNAGNVMSGPEIGTQLKNAHIIDLTVLPKKTSFTTSFYITVDVDFARSDDFRGYQRLFFVDKEGKIVYKYNLSYRPKRMEYSSGQYVYTYEITTDLSNINLPDSVVGFIPLYELWEVPDNSMTYCLNSITYEPFSFFYSLSDLEYEVQQNTALKNTLKDVQSAIEEQNKKFDDIANSKVDAVAPPGSDITDALDKQEQEIQGSAQEGLEQGKQTLTESLEVLKGYLDAFTVVKQIFVQFASLPFFSGLIIVSLSIGLVATLLGMGLEFKSFSVAEEKRKNAAAEKARRDHDRAEYRRRMLERSK